MDVVNQGFDQILLLQYAHGLAKAAHAREDQLLGCCNIRGLLDLWGTNACRIRCMVRNVGWGSEMCAEVDGKLQGENAKDKAWTGCMDGRVNGWTTWGCLARSCCFFFFSCALHT